MTRELTIAAAQMGPASGTRGETVERMVGLLAEAKAAQVDFLCFPELALTEYFCTVVRDSVEEYFESELPSPLTKPIFKAAKDAKISFVLPYAEKDGARYFNSSAIVDESGEVVGTYRKVHIPGTVEPSGEDNNILEKRYFTPGDLGFPVVDTGRARVGVQICYDRRFPESFRALGVNGAEIICTPYNTPAFDGDVEKGVDASDMCIRSAAYYNGCFAIGVGKGGVENGVRFIGGSFIAGPSGEVLARAASDGDELVTATVDLEEITTPRKTADRRPSEYAMLARG